MRRAVDIGRFGRCRILVIGDLMIDEYVWGAVDRISPEAPVPVVSVTRETDTLGGAGNVVNNLVALGAQASVAGVVGTGANGRRVRDMFTALGVDTSGIVDEPGRPTTRKTRVMAGSQHVLRVDRETKRPIAVDTVRRLSETCLRLMENADAVLVSDYAKGLLSPEFLGRIIAAARSLGRPVLVDPKGLDFSRYRGATLMTPNQKEASLASGIAIGDAESLSAAARRLMDATDMDHLLVTRGSEGMVLFGKDTPPRIIPAEARQVYDVSGAGDTVLSVLGLGIASGLSLADAAALANTAAGIVVGKMGTATVSQMELAAALKRFPGDLSPKYVSLTELVQAVDGIRQRGGRVVLTNGCFDLLHAGHIRLFQESRKLGDALVVAIDDDDSVRRLKGHGRPVLGAEERARVLSALDSVDYVLVFATEELPAILETLRPDILAKGGDYAPDQVRGHELLAAWGGRVALIPVTGDTSIGGIVNAIRDGGRRTGA